MTEYIIKLYSFFDKHKWLRRICLALLLLFFGFFAMQLSLEEDIAGFMPSNENNEKINFVYKNIGIAEKTIVKFSVKDNSDPDNKAELIAAVEYFAVYLDSLSKDKNQIKEIFYKIDQQKIFELTEFITANAPYYLDDADYAYIDRILNPDSIRLILENNKKLLMSPAGMVLKNNIMSDPLHYTGGTLSRLKDFQVSDEYQLYEDYIFSKDGNSLFVFITSANSVSETGKNQEMVNNIETSIATVSQNFEVKVTCFGAPAVAVSNAQRIKKDSYISIVIAVVLILGILFWFFRNVRSVMLIAVPVFFGALMSLAMLFFFKGTISAIAIGAGSVIFGIALNYSLHYLIHAKHEKNSENVLRDLASPMIVGSITTVSAFLSLLFISAESMRDFGLFAAFTLAGTLFYVLVFLPHSKGNSSKKMSSKHSGFIDRMSGYRMEKNKWILLAVILVTPVFFYFSFDVSFETEMNKINYMTPEQKQAFNDLSDFTSLGEKSMYLVADAGNLNDALVAYESMQYKVDSLIEKGSISGVSGIGTFLPSTQMQKQKLAKWNEFWKSRRDLLKNLLISEGAKVGFKENAFDNFFKNLYADYSIQKPEYFSIIIDNYIKDYLIVKDGRAMVITLIHAKPDKADDISKQLTIGSNFVFDSGSIAQSLVNTLSNDFNKVLIFCSILVLLFLTISFGRLELSLIAFLPMLLSWIWILGIMSIFGINFNIVNIILATFIFGLGDDYTIFMMEGSMSEYATSRKLLSSYKTAVALSSVTMFIGIGTLVFAKHPAMRSLADVTIVGMISVVLISFIIPPLLFNLITIKKGRRRLIPVTFVNFFATVYSFIGFLIGSFLLSAYGFFILGIGKKSKKNKYKFHKAVHKVTKAVAGIIPMVRYRIINEHNEDFSKPGIIICNHQSHIDLMYILLLSPKIVILTNEWVWNSPFYGRIVKYADFYPVANGIENSLEKLNNLIEDGYSIMVFPEGTRSEDCSILRFHRGAFYLAEKYNLDIIPVVTHGIGHALPKSELLLRKGKVSLKILERITPTNLDFGENYSQRAKLIRKHYQNEYSNLVQLNENTEYFKNLIIHNYIYKGASIEWYARKQLRKYKNFELLISILPNQGKILIPDCEYGVLSLICALIKKDLTVVATDINIEKIDIAANCISVPRNLTYINSDSKELSYVEFDAVILLNPNEETIIFISENNPIDLFVLLEKKNSHLISPKTLKIFEVVETEQSNLVILVKRHG